MRDSKPSKGNKIQKNGVKSASKAAKKSDNPKNDQEDSRSLIEMITSLHKSHKKRRKAHRKGVRSDIVEAVDIGLRMREDPKQWEDFCKNYWETGAPKINKIGEAVRYTLKFMTGPSKSAQKKASFYYNAIDWPVNKTEKAALSGVITNDGMHIHAIFMVPPNARTGARLGEIVARSPKSFLVGAGMPLARLHVEPIEKTAAQAALYALKQIPRKKVTSADILVLPRSHREL